MKKDTFSPFFDITAILAKGAELKLDPKNVLIIALWLISNEGRQEIMKIAMYNSADEVEINKDNMQKKFDKIVSDIKYKAFYEALKVSLIVTKE